MTFGTVLLCLELMPPGAETFSNGAEGGQEPLGVPG